MAQILESFSGFLGTFSEHEYIDDGFDRANRVYAPVVLMVFASLLALIQFLGDPIQCTNVNVDAKVDDDYLKAYCWVKGTYTLTLNEKTGKLDDSSRLLDYYQWVSVVLAVQACSFHLPYLFWVSFSSGSGLNLPSLMKGAFEMTKVHEDASKREGYCQEVAYLMNAYFKRNITKSKKSWKAKTLHNLTACYFLSKVFYITNIALQLWLVNSFLEFGLSEYAFKSLGNLLSRQKWKPSPVFPLLSVCRFFNNIKDFKDAKDKDGKDKDKGDKEVLCSLPLNLYNDKVFCSVVLMLVLMLILMLASLVVWTVRFVAPSQREALVVNILRKHDQSKVDRFIGSYLRTDGILVMKLIRMNLGVNTATEIVESLFQRFATELDDNLKFKSVQSQLTLDSFRMNTLDSQSGMEMNTLDSRLGAATLEKTPLQFQDGRPNYDDYSSAGSTTKTQV